MFGHDPYDGRKVPELEDEVRRLGVALDEAKRKADDHRRKGDEQRLLVEKLTTALGDAAREHNQDVASILEIPGLRDKLTQDELHALLRWRSTFARAKAKAAVARTLDELDDGARETVICAAIRLPDGRIFRGHRHGDCIRTAREAVNWNGGVDPWREGDWIGRHEYWHPSMCEDQGFITSRNRYVDRQEGMRLQLAAGIESVAKGGYRGETLFSEDLY
jgi:hypothetical protein